MSILNIDVKLTDLAESQWESALTKAKRPTIDDYASEFKKISNEHETKGLPKQASILSLLSQIGYMHLSPKDTDGPFIPMMSGPAGRTLLPEDLTETELSLLEELFSQTKDAELKARLGDVLWLRRKDYKAAEAAIDAYMDSAARLEEQEEFDNVPVRFERALGLAALFGGIKSPKVEQVLDAIVTIVRNRADENNTFCTFELLDLLLDRRYGDPAEWANISKSLAQHLNENSDFHTALLYWDRAVQAFKLAKNNKLLREAQICEAETYVSLADEAPTEMVKSSFIRDAFEAYRQISDTDGRREELHQRLLRHQEKAVAEMGEISTEVDFSDFVKQVRNAVKNQDFIQALYSLALITSPIDPDQLLNETKEAIKKTPLQFIIKGERVNAIGRVLGVKPGGMEDPDGALMAMMHSNANFYHQIDVDARINPARLQIIHDHPLVQVRDLMPLTQHNAFVPLGRQVQFARGLYAGLKGDFIICGHLLIPQVENSLRVTLQRMGVITTSLDSTTKRQNEYSLNVTLSNFKEQLEQIFKSEIIFELQNLLVEPFGANLRNEAMHGLLDDDMYFSHPIVYFWWLVLRLCCLGNQGPLPEGFARGSTEKSETNDQSMKTNHEA
ncbi:MAG: DUF4209 domain-containing protein [Candidatus Glassbacteria bacterium]